jgi:hypothetical protein
MHSAEDVGQQLAYANPLRDVHCWIVAKHIHCALRGADRLVKMSLLKAELS